MIKVIMHGCNGKMGQVITADPVESAALLRQFPRLISDIGHNVQNRDFCPGLRQPYRNTATQSAVSLILAFVILLHPNSSIIRITLYGR